MIDLIEFTRIVLEILRGPEPIITTGDSSECPEWMKPKGYEEG